MVAPLPARPVLIALAGLSLLAACSTTSHSASGHGRSVDVVMRDNRFEPDQLTARRGEVITIRFRNQGSVRHEALAGDEAAQQAHHREMAGSTATGSTPMATMPGDAGHPADDGHHGPQPGMVVVEPGATGELTMTVPESGTIVLGCHEPGHWESGMKLSVGLI